MTSNDTNIVVFANIDTQNVRVQSMPEQQSCNAERNISIQKENIVYWHEVAAEANIQGALDT